MNLRQVAPRTNLRFRSSPGRRVLPPRRFFASLLLNTSLWLGMVTFLSAGLSRSGAVWARGSELDSWLAPSLVLAVNTGAQESISLSVQAGLDGFCKEGRWIPVHVTIENGGEDVEGRLEVQVFRLNNQKSVYAQSVSLPGLARKALFLYVYPEGFLSEIEVLLVSADRSLAEATVRVSCAGQTDRLYAVMAASPSPFHVFAEIRPPNGNAQLAFLDPDDLPDLAQGLEALDVLAISGVDTGQLNPGQQAALQGWVMRGGRLLVTGGPAWQKTSAGLGGLLPLAPQGTTERTGLNALEGYSQNPDDLSGEAIVTTGSLAAESQVLVEQDGLPLILRRSYGYGEILYLAVDPALAPLKDWEGVDGLFRRLLAPTVERPDWAYGFQNWDLAFDASGTLPDFGLPGAPLIAGFLGLYILAIGPANYLVLKRLKRREFAWITIPALVILFGAITFLAGARALGRRPILSRLAVVQSWPGVQQARLDGLVGTYSPRRDRFRLELGSGYLAHTLPAGALSQATDWLFLRDETGQTLVPALSVDVGGIRSIAVDGQVPAPHFEGELVLELATGEPAITGRLVNRSELTLEDAVLLAPGARQPLGKFGPGEQKNISFRMPLEARAQPAASGPSGPYVARPYGGSDTLFTDLLGPGDFYRSQVVYRRFTLLSALLGAGYGGSGSPGGIYLAGWSQLSPMPASLGGINFGASDMTLYLARLPAEFGWEGDTAQIPPGLFTWSALSAGSSGAAAPYDTWIDPGGYSLQFRPSLPVQYGSVKELVLHLQGTGSSGASGLVVSLWDYTQNAWVELGEFSWGDSPIPDPGRFVQPGGEIRLQLVPLNTLGQQQILRSDFTLVVEK